MRKINFRGKRADGEWVYGDYHKRAGNVHCILTMEPDDEGKVSYEANQVDADTIGQFTGLRDKNGKEIYEGDILLWVANTKIEPYENGQEVNGLFKRHLVVAWAPQCQGFGLCLPCEAHIDSPDVCAMAPADRMHIIGNIHDNPEMLKAEVCKDKEEEGDCPLLRKL